MSRFLLAWEIGTGYGHIANLLALADAAVRRGHQPVLALRSLGDAEIVLGDRGFRVVQAPTFTGAPPPRGAPCATYPGILAMRGYDRAHSVAGLLKGWLRLLELVAPDFLIVDYAPAAVLAARLHGVPVAAVGTSFMCPPRTVPLPVLPGEDTPRALQLAVEATVLDAVNGALAGVGGEPLWVLAEMFPPVADALTTFPELDHYGADPGRTYWGLLGAPFGQARPRWPAGAGPRVLAYVQGWDPGFPKLVADLLRLGAPTIVHARKVSRDAPAGPSLTLETAPVDFDHLLGEADLVICHASHGVAALALLRGVPLVTLPLHNEQAAISRRAVALGAALAGPGSSPAFDHAALVDRALHDPTLACAAAGFAERHARSAPAAVPHRILESCEALLARGRG